MAKVNRAFSSNSAQWSEYMVITKEFADKALATKAINRKITDSSVGYFVGELKGGTFCNTHQGIAFNTEDRLIDGQNRLTAISITGIPAEMMVTYGCPAEKAMEWPVDCGNKRLFYMQAGISTNHAADIDRCLSIVAEETRRFSTAERMTALRILDPIQKRLHEICPTMRRAITSTTNRVAVLLRMSGGNEYAAQQYRALVHQAYDDMTPAIQAYCRKLVTPHLKLEETATVKQARAWDAFNPDLAKGSKQTVRDPFIRLDEMRAVLLGLGFPDIRSETKKTAKQEVAVEKAAEKKKMWAKVLEK